MLSGMLKKRFKEEVVQEIWSAIKRNEVALLYMNLQDY